MRSIFIRIKIPLCAPVYELRGFQKRRLLSCTILLIHEKFVAKSLRIFSLRISLIRSPLSQLSDLFYPSKFLYVFKTKFLKSSELLKLPLLVFASSEIFFCNGYFKFFQFFAFRCCSWNIARSIACQNKTSGSSEHYFCGFW